MKLDDTIEHLSDRGFITRKSWNLEAVLFIAGDSQLHISRADKTMNPYVLRLVDTWMDDWIIIPFYWKSSNSNFELFENNNIEKLVNGNN